MRKNIFFAVPLMVAVLISACADSGDSNNTPPAPQTYDITGKIDYAGKTISSAKVCLDVNNNGMADDNACVDTSNGEYTFTSSNNPSYYPLAAFITEDTSAAVNAKITVDNSDYDSILYAPRGKTETISIATTLAKSLMDKDSALSLTDAESTANRIITNNANNNPATVLTVYNNALNSANITDISTSIRGLVNVITDKLNKETSITDSTNIIVTQDEVNTANDEITKADEEQPQEPQEPENPSGELTPLEKVTEMLAGAEIKNGGNPVNLNEYVTSVSRNQAGENGPVKVGQEIYISADAFDGLPSNAFFTQMSILGQITPAYNENGWPSDKQGFEVFHEDKNEYTFSNFHSGDYEYSNACEAGKVSGITYKPIIDDAINKIMDEQVTQCATNLGVDINNIGPDDISKLTKCSTDTFYNNRDKFKIEKWYWTIDTTQLDACQNGSSSTTTDL